MPGNRLLPTVNSNPGPTAVALAALLISFGWLSSGASVAAQQGASPTAPLVQGPDFNGDGFADLAIGVVDESLGDVTFAGAVNVVYGSAAGLTADGAQFWNQDSPGVLGAAEESDAFGFALGDGDFDGDGYTDLAVGVPDEDVSSHPQTGAVNVLYGSAAGLAADGNQFFHQDTPGIPGQAGLANEFGLALAAADFNGDGRDDLAIGAPCPGAAELGCGNGPDQGVVTVVYGSPAGLNPFQSELWHQDNRGVRGNGSEFDQFGYAVVSADFNQDGYADLGVGAPSDGDLFRPEPGEVNVLYGSGAGLTAAGNQLWSQDSPEIEGEAESGDFFGSSLAAGDMNGDGYPDLAVGVPAESLDASGGDEGAVNLLFGSSAGLTAGGNQFLSQDSPGIVGDGEEDDAFGGALELGDIDGDGFFDLVVGVLSEDIGGVVNAGSVVIVFGAATVRDQESQLVAQDQAGVEGVAQQHDAFGLALTANDFDGDGYADLAVGVPCLFGQFPPCEDTRGEVNVLYGSPFGPSRSDDELFTQDTPGIPDEAEPDDFFGYSLA